MRKSSSSIIPLNPGSLTLTFGPEEECIVTIDPSEATVLVETTREFCTSTECDGETVEGTYEWELDEGLGELDTYTGECVVFTGGYRPASGELTATDTTNRNATDTANVTVVSCRTSADCNDHLFCNGEERCIGGKCYPGNFPCSDDGLFCNGEEGCNEEKDKCIHSVYPCPDDGLFCNGEKSCDEEADACMSSGDPCQDDGLYCNGEESCDEENDVCLHFGDPCPPDEECAEENDRCFPTIAPLSFTLIPDSVLRSHLIPLPLFMFIVSDDPGTKFDRTSTEVSFSGDTIIPPWTLVLSEDLIFTFSLILPSGLGVTGSSEVAVTVTTNESEGTVTLTLIMLPWILEE